MDDVPGFTLTPDLGESVAGAAAGGLAAGDRAYVIVQDLLNQGYPYLEDFVWLCFGCAVGWSLMMWAIDAAGNRGGGFAATLTPLLVRLGIFLWLAGQWKMVIDAVGNFALDVGVRISGSTVPREKLMVPSGLFAQGNEQAALVMEAKNALCDSWTSCIVTLGDQLLLEVIAIAIWVMFGILVLTLVMAALWLKKAGLFSFLFLPASQVRATAFLAEGAISGIFRSFLWLAFISMVAGWGTRVIPLMALPEHPDAASLVPGLLVVSFMAMAAWQSRGYASGIVSGVPSIGGEAVTATARNALGWATGGAMLANRMQASARMRSGGAGGGGAPPGGGGGGVGGGVGAGRAGAVARAVRAAPAALRAARSGLAARRAGDGGGSAPMPRRPAGPDSTDWYL